MYGNMNRIFKLNSLNRHLYWAGVGALLARGMPLAAVSISWNFTALFGRTIGGLIAVCMLCSFMAMLFMMNDNRKEAAHTRVWHFMLLLILYVSGRTLFRPIPQGRPVISIVIFVDYLLIALTLWTVFFLGYKSKISKHSQVAGIISIILCLSLPYILRVTGIPFAERTGAALLLLSSGGLICAAARSFLFAESRFSRVGLLLGFSAIMLIDIVL